MRKATAELILKDPGKYAHHDRVFLNNPVVMQSCWRRRWRCCWYPPACWPAC